MTTERIPAARCLEILGWSGAHLSRELGTSERTVNRWFGDGTMPDSVCGWLDAIASHRKRFPAPDWRAERSRDRHGVIQEKTTS